MNAIEGCRRAGQSFETMRTYQDFSWPFAFELCGPDAGFCGEADYAPYFFLGLDPPTSHLAAAHLRVSDTLSLVAAARQ
jgi:hypothetical protein